MLYQCRDQFNNAQLCMLAERAEDKEVNMLLRNKIQHYSTEVDIPCSCTPAFLQESRELTDRKLNMSQI